MRWHRKTVAAALAVAVVVMFSGDVTGQTPAGKPGDSVETEARALLLLAKAGREREETKFAAACNLGKCFETKPEAEKASRLKGGVPIIFWVGMKCEDSPTIREKLSDFVHCHLKTWNGSPEPRIVFTDSAERDWAIGKAELDSDSPEEIRQLLKLPQVKKK